MDTIPKENVVEDYLHSWQQYQEKKVKENNLMSEVEAIQENIEEALLKTQERKEQLNKEIKDRRAELKKELKKQKAAFEKKQEEANLERKIYLTKQLEKYIESEQEDIEGEYNKISNRRSALLTEADREAEIYLNKHLLPLLPQAAHQIFSDNQANVSRVDLDSARNRYVEKKTLEELEQALKNGTYQPVSPRIDFLSYFRKPKNGDSGAYEWIDVAKSFVLVGVGTAIIRNIIHFLFGWLGNLWAQIFPDFVNLISGLLNVLGYGPLFIAGICLIIAMISSILHIEIEQPFDNTVSKQLQDSDTMLFYLVAVKDYSIIELIRETVSLQAPPFAAEFQILLADENRINDRARELEYYKEDAENALANNEQTYPFKVSENMKESLIIDSFHCTLNSEKQPLIVTQLIDRLKECEIVLYKFVADSKAVQVSFKHELDEKLHILDKTRTEIFRLVELMNKYSKEWVSVKPNPYLVTIPDGLNLGLTPDPDNNDGLTDYWNIINHKNKAVVFNYDSSNDEHGIDIIRNFIASFLMNTTGIFLYYNLYYFNEDQTQAQIMKSAFIRNSAVAKNCLRFTNETDKKFLENAGGIFRNNAKTTIAETNITELKNGQATIFDPMNIKKYHFPIIRIDKKYANLSLLQQVSRNAAHWGVIPFVFINAATVEQSVLDSEFMEDARKDGRYYDMTSDVYATTKEKELVLCEEDYRKLGQSLVRIQIHQEAAEVDLARDFKDERLTEKHNDTVDIEVETIFEQQKIEVDASEKDSLYDDVVAFIKDDETVSISKLQRRFRIGYNRAACLIDVLEESGMVEQAEDGNVYMVNNLENAF